MTTSEQRAELVQVGREFVRITRERDQEDQGDPYATPVANLVEAITDALKASEAEKARLIEAVRHRVVDIEVHNHNGYPEQVALDLGYLRHAVDEAEGDGP